MADIIMVNYKADNSVAGRAVVDMQLGLKHGAVGFDRSERVRRGDRVLVKAGWTGPWAAGVILRENDAHTDLWQKHGGRTWRRTFDVEFLTPVVQKAPGLSLKEAKACHWSQRGSKRVWHKAWDAIVGQSIL